MIYPKDFINKIVLGDSIEVMKEIPDDSVDLIFTDPPYGIDKKKIKGDEDFGLFRKSLIECYRILKDNCFYLTFIGTGQFDKVFIDNPFTYRWTAILYIDNGMVSGNLGLSSYIPCMVFQKGDAKIKHRISDVMKMSTSSKLCSKRYHPYEKYIPFIKRLLKNVSNKNDIVLDPFLGSGTTAVACKELGRRFIGIEINPEYCKVAEERLKLTRRDNKQLMID